MYNVQAIQIICKLCVGVSHDDYAYYYYVYSEYYDDDDYYDYNYIYD